MTTAKEMRVLFDKRMEKFKSTEDAHFLCEIASTYALFEILDELQGIIKKCGKK
ncbi:MAG: hypothetical protein V1703_00850 [Candidatus Altiarchaeota archaeon]